LRPNLPGNSWHEDKEKTNTCNFVAKNMLSILPQNCTDKTQILVINTENQDSKKARISFQQPVRITTFIRVA
jgi:hypothetical protein